MEGEAIRRILEAARSPVEHVCHGKNYLTIPEADGGYRLEAMPSKESSPDPLEVATLTGLVDYLDANKDDLFLPHLLVHVVDAGKVEIRSRLESSFQQRFTYLTAQASAIGLSFPFGQFLDVETFLVQLQSLFVETEQRQSIVKLLANLKDDQVRTFADDGISQSVTAKIGVATVGEAKVPNPVCLQPYRTFREIDQPASDFVFRLRKGDTGPLAALFEADGGAWKLTAIEEIAQFLGKRLEQHDPDIAILA
jgi:hypothetical protein